MCGEGLVRGRVHTGWWRSQVLGDRNMYESFEIEGVGEEEE